MTRSTDQSQADEDRRREELLAKVREANRQSASRPHGPPSPDPVGPADD